MKTMKTLLIQNSKTKLTFGKLIIFHFANVKVNPKLQYNICLYIEKLQILLKNHFVLPSGLPSSPSGNAPGPHVFNKQHLQVSSLFYLAIYVVKLIYVHLNSKVILVSRIYYYLSCSILVLYVASLFYDFVFKSSRFCSIFSIFTTMK